MDPGRAPIGAHRRVRVSMAHSAARTIGAHEIRSARDQTPPCAFWCVRSARNGICMSIRSARDQTPHVHFGASDRRAIIHIHDRCLHSAAPPLQCLANIMGPDPSLRFPEREAGIFTVCLPRHRRSFGTPFEAMAGNYGSCHQTDNALENNAWTAISWSPQGTPST